MITAASSHYEKPLPRFVRDLLSSPPSRGGGLHNWFFRTARVLHAFRSHEEIVELLRSATAGEAVKAGEIEDAVRNSADKAWQPQSRASQLRQPAWPPVNAAKRTEIIERSAGLSDLWELSPVPFEDDDAHTEEIIDVLFPGDPWLCCGLSNDRFKTRRRSDWRGSLADQQLIVPSPMTGEWGETKDGKKSHHTLANTGPRRFLVVEQDQGILDEQAAILVHLAQKAPLVLAVHSGSKSIHGWFYCEGRAEDRLRKFMDYAVSLGADRATWTRAQFVRMPDGMRDNGNRQSIYYFNPEALK
jgi:hypothetical protein